MLKVQQSRENEALDAVEMPSDFQVLQVGITTRCNQICTHCPRETMYEGMQTMSLAQFDGYLSKFDARNFKSLIVSDFGEITIVPDILDYLRAAKNRGFQGVHFVTNATRKAPDFWQAIADERLVSYVIVSLEAAEDPLYESIRGHAFSHFRTVLDQIAQAFSSVTPRIPLIMNAVCMKENIGNLSEIVQLAADVSADELIFVHLNPTNYANRSAEKLCIPEQHLDTCDRQEVLSAFSKVIELAKEKELRLTLPEKFPELTGEVLKNNTVPYQHSSNEKLRCQSPINWVQVGMDGEVYPCCQMSQRLSMGSLQEHSFAKLWNGAAYQRLFEGLAVGGEPNQVCRECNVFKGKNF